MASYLGNLTSTEFRQKNGYRLWCNDSAQSIKIQSQFEGMKANGSFPESTKLVEHFECHVDVSNEEGSSLKIKWVDYPGNWWTEEPHTQELQKIRAKEFSYLLESQVGVLLIDGQKYSARGMGYVKDVLRSFDSSFKKLIDDKTWIFGMMTPTLPKTWIIALSKCDTLDEGLSAENFRSALIVNCFKEILALNATIKSVVSNNVILFSSVKANGMKILDTAGTGLELFSAVGIAAEVDRILDENKSEQARHPFYEAIIDAVDRAIEFFVPEKFKLVVIIAKKLDFAARLQKKRSEHLNNLQGEEKYIASALACLRKHLDNKDLAKNHTRYS